MNSDPRTKAIEARNLKLKTESKMGSVFFEDSINTQFMKALRQSKKKIFTGASDKVQVFRTHANLESITRSFNPMQPEIFDRAALNKSLQGTPYALMSGLSTTTTGRNDKLPMISTIPTRNSLSPVPIADAMTGQTSMMSTQLIGRISEANSKRSLELLNGGDSVLM